MAAGPYSYQTIEGKDIATINTQLDKLQIEGWRPILMNAIPFGNHTMIYVMLERRNFAVPLPKD
ncbi:MAG TPA: hypothetical protein VHA33_09985 [Candidatus Angelobacter sp.]|jgi:hypothetical protein|nr:hypothetical protein [Candidatus Angelobacter sp.]